MSLVAAATAATAAKSTPFIDWASLGKVAGAALVFGVGVVVLFAVGIVGLGWAMGDGTTGRGTAPNKLVGAALAAVCLLACAGGVAYGLWIIIPQFHGK